MNSSYKQDRYQDESIDEGVCTATRATIQTSYFKMVGSEATHLLDVPIVYFVGTAELVPADLPTYVERRAGRAPRPSHLRERCAGRYDERESVHIPDEIERRYVVREVKQRIHKRSSRGAVLPAYQDRCAICRLREVRLLDAAHIVGDAEEAGEPIVSNGLSLCSIHHRAFDEDLVGVAPDLRVHVSRRLLDDDDGPMLDVLKTFHGSRIEAPTRRIWRPDADRLELRFERFQSAG